jgi:hypothetical protein
MSEMRIRNDSLGDVWSDKEIQQLPEEVKGLLDTAFQREKEEHWEEYAILGPEKTRELDVFVIEQSIGTIREWFSVNNENLGMVNPKPYVLVSPAALEKQEKVSDDRLTQADVNHWVDYWWLKGLIFEPANVRVLKTSPYQLDAATEHRRRIEELRENKEKKNRHD